MGVHLLGEARRPLDDRSIPDGTAIHDFRRAMKRWRAVLRLLSPRFGEEPDILRREARDLSRLLSSARDLQSGLDAFDDLTSHGLTLPERTAVLIRHRLCEEIAAGESNVLTPDTRAKLSAGIDRASAAVERWPLQDLSFDDVAVGLTRGYRAARRARPDDWSEADDEALHDLRKRIIDHRYQMTLMEPLWPRVMRSWIGEAQRLRERLGQHQDLSMLKTLISPNQPLARWRSHIAPVLAEHQTRHATAAKRIATRLLVERPNSFHRRLSAIWSTAS
ncbi:MAG TPA: CHAD domain-containing protein [Bradyrhizobium sp.]|nr:CHAD domain-containing protein [Bradyrhizobium sp.]